MPLVQAVYDRGTLQLLLSNATLKRAGRSKELGEGVRDAAEKVRSRAVRNVSGYPVSYEGRAFVVRSQTGALKAALEMEWPYKDILTARVFVNGTHTSTRQQPDGRASKPVPVSRYASAIEHGHKEIDLKKTMMGKTVPFFGARSKKAVGPYLEKGLVAIGGGEFISSMPRAHPKGPMVYKRKRTKPSGSSYFIAFRKVGKTGWIIPKAEPRPFMAAAAVASIPDVRTAVARRIRPLLMER